MIGFCCFFTPRFKSMVWTNTNKEKQCVIIFDAQTKDRVFLAYGDSKDIIKLFHYVNRSDGKNGIWKDIDDDISGDSIE